MAEALLIVDDEEKILRSIERMLIDRDLKILKARNAREALDLIRNEEISVILSDNMMPGMTGVDMLSLAKSHAPDTIRILMTGRADLPTAIDAINKGEVFRFVTKPWNNEDLRQTITEGIERHRIIGKLRKADEASLLSIGQAIELKDPYTRGHCQRVATYSLLLAGSRDLSEDARRQIKHGSWLHDCGKIGITETVLNKQGPLSEEEFEIMRNHPAWGADIARQAQLSEMIVNIILHHHEHFDGRGYPAGLAGEDIPLEARIVAVADVFDAMTTDRPYRQGLRPEEALEEMQCCMRGTVLDSALLDAFSAEIQKYSLERASLADGCDA